MVASPAGFSPKVCTTVAVCVYAKEAKHTQRECGGDGEERSSPNPNDYIGPPWEKEVARIFRVSVVVGVDLLPVFKNWELPKRTVKDEPVKGIKKEGANSMPSHK
jgi:hypothetical protein